MEQIYINKKQIAALLNLKQSTINSMIINKKIPCYKISKDTTVVLFDKAEIAEWIKNKQVQAANQPLKGV